MTSRVVALVLALGLPATGWAENLRLGFDAQTGWDDNVFFSTSDEEDSFPYRLSPWMDLRRERGDLTYSLNLRVVYEDFFDQSGADTFDEVVRLNGRYHLSETTQFTFSDTFTRVQSLQRRLENADPAGDIVPEIENARQRSMQNSASVGVGHSLSRRWSVNAGVTHSFFDFQDDDFVDSEAIGASASLNYALTRKDNVGFGGGVSFQDFEEVRSRPGSETKFYRLFGVWSHVFDPTLSMSLQAGPTWVRTSSDVGPSDSRFTYFGAANLRKRWETVSAVLSYTRTDSTAAGLSGSTVLDTVNGSVVWKPSERWNLSLLAAWTRRESATTQFATEFVRGLPIPPGAFFCPVGDQITFCVRRQIDTDDSVDQFRIVGNAERRLTRYFSVFSTMTWFQQKRNISSFTSTGTTQDRFQIIVGIRWQTQPFFF